MEISHDSHHHKLVLKPAICPYYCGACDQLGFGSSYSCTKSDCNFFLHEHCGKPEPIVKCPFSDKCVLNFRTQGYGQDSLCIACMKKIKGFHYRCTCTFIKRSLHPFCLSHNQTIKAMDGLTLYLKKAATTKCLHCETKDVWYKARGWAYVSSCGNYCYHVSCVMQIINENWRNGFFSGKSDPFQAIKQAFPADMDRMQQVVRRKKDSPTTNSKQATKFLSIIFKMLTGNHLGLIGDAQSYFSN